MHAKVSDQLLTNLHMLFTAQVGPTDLREKQIHACIRCNHVEYDNYSEIQPTL